MAHLAYKVEICCRFSLNTMQRPSCSEPKIDEASKTLEMESALAIFPIVYGCVFGKVTNKALETAMGASEPPLPDVKPSLCVVPEASNAFLFRFSSIKDRLLVIEKMPSCTRPCRLLEVAVRRIVTDGALEATIGASEPPSSEVKFSSLVVPAKPYASKEYRCPIDQTRSQS